MPAPILATALPRPDNLGHDVAASRRLRVLPARSVCISARWLLVERGHAASLYRAGSPTRLAQRTNQRTTGYSGRTPIG